MKIEKLTITHDELKQAVEAYLATQGVKCPIEDLERRYTYGKTWEVTFIDEVKASMPAIEPLPKVMSAETLAAAIAPTAEPVAQ